MFYIQANTLAEASRHKYIPIPLQYAIVSYLNVKENLVISLVNHFFNVTSKRDAYWLQYIYTDKNFNQKLDFCSVLFKNRELLCKKNIHDNKSLNLLKAKYIEIYKEYNNIKISNPKGITSRKWMFCDFQQTLTFTGNYTCEMERMPPLVWSCHKNLALLLFQERVKIIRIPENSQPKQLVKIQRRVSLIIDEQDGTSVILNIQHEGLVPDGPNVGDEMSLSLVVTDEIKELCHSIQSTNSIYINNFPVHTVVRLDSGGYVAYNEVIYFFSVNEFDENIKAVSNILDGDCDFENKNGYYKMKLINSYKSEGTQVAEHLSTAFLEKEGLVPLNRLIFYKSIFSSWRSLYNNFIGRKDHPHLMRLLQANKDNVVRMRKDVFIASDKVDELEEEPSWPEEVAMV